MTQDLFNWNNEAAVTELKELWQAGDSLRECARKLMIKFGGVLTRGSVCGKIHRLGMVGRKRNTELRQKPVKPKRTPRKKPVTKFSPRIASNTVFMSPSCDEPIVSSLSPDEIPLHQRKQLFDLKHNDCRWPYGDPGKPGFFFCGAVKTAQSSYCEFHSRVAGGRRFTIEERQHGIALYRKNAGDRDAA